MFNEKLREWEDYYNYHRPHGALDGQTPYQTATLKDQSSSSVNNVLGTYISSPIAIPRGVTAIGIFLLFGAVVASLLGMTLAWPGTAFDRMWAFNPRAFRELAPFGKTVGISFVLLGVTLSVASVGWFKRRLWGWRLAVFIIATQVLGGLIHVFLGRVLEGGVGVAIAGALLLYLLRVKVRAVFSDDTGIPLVR